MAEIRAACQDCQARKVLWSVFLKTQQNDTSKFWNETMSISFAIGA